MRWPSDAVSLVGHSLNLDTGKTYKLMPQLREHSTTYLTKLWQLTVDRTGEQHQSPKCKTKANSGESYPQFEPNS